MEQIKGSDALREAIDQIVEETPILDMHTHIFPPDFGDLLLWGIDELVTYHYLVAELFRKVRGVSPAGFWEMPKMEQADLIWRTLFVENSPVSEACRGVLTVLHALGIEDLRSKSLDDIRAVFADKNANDYIDEVMRKANVRTVVMTNDPFDEQERSVWERGFRPDPRFRAALRIDALLAWSPDNGCRKLKSWGYDVAEDLTGQSAAEIRRFLGDWIARMRPVYLAASLPWDFTMPGDSSTARIMEACVLPVCRAHRLSMALMIGVRRQLNPELRLAGDGVGKADLSSLEYLLRAYPKNKFLVTVLSRENQHELCVLARKFSNLMVFGCWWFLNDPSIIEEMTRERFELLGLSFVPQHSDARVLDQLIYKWAHFRKVLKPILFDKYHDLLDTGWSPTREEIQRDVEGLFGRNFERFVE